MSRICSRVASLTILALALYFFCEIEAQAQMSDVETIAPSRLTDGLISRNELRSLLSQPPSDRNPLRHNQSQPMAAPPIIDHNVRQTVWQEETPSAPTAQTPPVHSPSSLPTAAAPAIPLEGSTEIPPPMIGPMPSPAMQDQWQMQDMLLDFSVDKLKQEVDEHRALLGDSLGIDEEAQNDRLRELQIADDAVQQAMKNNAAKAELQNRVMQLSDELERLRQDAKQSSLPPSVAMGTPIEALQATLRNLNAELDHEKIVMRKTNEGIQQRDERMARIPTQRIESRNEVNKRHEELLQKQATGTAEIEVLLSLRARELEASTKVQLLDQEASWHDLSRELLPLKKSINQKKLQRLEQDINIWNEAIASRKQADLEAQIRIAQQKAWDTHPALKAFSLETSELAQARAELAEKIGTLQKEKLKVSTQQDEIHAYHTRLETSLKDTGKEGSSNILIEVHRNLIRPWEGMARILSLKSELQMNRSLMLKRRGEEELVSHPETFIPDQLNIKQDESVANTTLIAMAEEAVATHREQLHALVGDHEQYGILLNDVLPMRQKLLEEIAETRELVDTHALWVQSADPLDVQVLAKSREGAQEFFDHGQWKELGSSIVSHIRYRPWECALGMLGLMVAFVVGRRFQN